MSYEEAKKCDASMYDEAMAVFAQAQAAKGQKQLDACNRTITLAGQALSKTVQMVEAAEARATNSKLTKQQEAITERLTKALGKMASGAKTNHGYVVSLSGVAFATGESALNTEGKYVLPKLSGVMLAFDDMKLSIEGHTDSTGSDEANHKLSLARADSVKAFLAEMGVPASIMTTQGFGAEKPLMPNDTPEGRAKNRRVEIVLIEGR